MNMSNQQYWETDIKQKAEIEQLRSICAEQHEALKRAQVCLAFIPALSGDEPEEGSTYDMVEKAIAKYDSLVRRTK